MSQAGQNNLITDVDGILLGNAQDERVKTGTSVIVCEEPSVAAMALAGGGPGTRETDLLKSDTLVTSVDAICLSGGSAFGLGAADGVMAGLKEAGRGFGLMAEAHIPKTPIVPTAILYDLANGGEKDWGHPSPYPELGYQAFKKARKEFTLGKQGAGYGAKAGQLEGGLGSASFVTSEGFQIGALAAVNAFGATQMPGTECYWAWPYEIDAEFGGCRPPPDYQLKGEDWGAAKANPQPGQNTTLGVVATNIALTPSAAQRVASMALSGFSRAIRPVFTPFDGDIVFVLSSGRVPLAEPSAFTLARLGELAALTLARSIARGVYAANRA